MKFRIFSLILVTAFYFISCGDDDSATDPYENIELPDSLCIVKIDPESAYKGETVNIIGNYFGDERGESYVRFKINVAAESDYISWTNTKIKLKVPQNALTGDVTVNINGVKTNAVPFVVLSEDKPTITTINPDEVYPGGEMMIEGVNFGDSRGDNYVSFNGEKPESSDYSKWSDTEIVVNVPETAVSGKLFLRVDGDESNSIDFTILDSKPEIDSLSVRGGATGDEIEIYGKFFGSTAGKVKIHETETSSSDIVSWSDYKIRFKIPEGAESGLLRVVLGSKESNSVDFAVGDDVPVIDYLPTTIARPGYTFIIEGFNFGDTHAPIIIYMNEIVVPIESIIEKTSTKIVFVVPSGIRDGKLQVVIWEKFSNKMDYTVENVNPEIIDMQPATPSIGETIVLYGKNFGPIRNDGYIKINEDILTEANYVSWEDTRIEFKFPHVENNGFINVFAGGKFSNDYEYNIYTNIVKMIPISKGSFMMGSESGDWSKPVHKVNISYDFFMSETEITQTQWKEVFGDVSNPSKHPGDQNPVDQVNWFRAVKFCNELSTIEGLTPCYTISGEEHAKEVTCNFDANGYRLPTEAEWEYACRAGSTGDYDGNISDMGWTTEDYVDHTQAVRQKEANSWGLYDMHGNVAEWCHDGFDSYFYEESPENDPVKNADYEYQEVVLRGGSYMDSPGKCTSWYRGGLGPKVYQHYVGFRIVRKKM